MRIERTVAADASRVWELLVDLDRAEERLSGVDRLERLDDGESFGLGTRWRETRTMLGRQASEEMEVTAVEPGRSYTVEADSGGVRYRSVLGVEPTGPASSRLWMDFEGQPQGVVGKVLAATVGKLAQRSTRKVMRQDLDDIAAAAEAPA